MKKSEQQIEREFFALVRDSALGQAIRGGIYRADMRPADADTEDMVIKMLSGSNERPKTVPFAQSGVMVINIYVPPVQYTDGRRVRDNGRISELQELLAEFIESRPHGDYFLEADGAPQSAYNPDIEQHLVYARFNYSRYYDTERRTITLDANQIKINTQIL